MLFRSAVALRSALPRLQFADLHGFVLVESRVIADLNLCVYSFRHTKTEALYYHIDADDANNHFCIGFRTPAQNDKGTSHVLEHTTLCGSQRYPVRDPFFLMMRRSLSSFMNAMTGADYTLYPFSTVNHRDYGNLLRVYLDAVFCPLLRAEDFAQEGHRVEVADLACAGAVSDPTIDTSPASDTDCCCAGVANGAVPASTSALAKSRPRLVYNGVVFNEMRGVVSDPAHHFSRSLLRTVLPETHYTYESGGHPLALLQLTYDELVQFHRSHYHPSNSVTFTYGNQHPSSHMEQLDAYFSKFARREAAVVPTLSDSCRLTAPQVVYLDGPLDAMGNVKRQKRVAVAYATPRSHDTLEDVIAYSVLDTLLSHGPSAPMYRALIESQIGSEYTPMHGFAYYLSSPVISYGVAGVDETRTDVEAEVRRAVTTALRQVSDDGFDVRRVRAVVFQEELHQRHRAADYGIHACTGLCAMALCRAQHNPLDFINWLPQLQAIAASEGASLLRYVREGMLDNPHSAVVSVAARADFLPRLQAQLQGVEDELNLAASSADVASIAQASQSWLQRVRAPQDASVLPSLTVDDIPVRSFAEPQPQRSNRRDADCVTASGVSGNSHAATAMQSSKTTSAAVYTLAHPTNGLVYVHGLVPFARTLARAIAVGECMDDIPAHLPLVCSLLARTGAGALSYKQQAVEHELVCNRFAFAPTLGESYTHRRHVIAGVYCNFFTTVTQLESALALLRTTLCDPHTRDDDDDVRSRVLSLGKTHCSHAITGLQAHGNRIAMSCAVGQLTRRGAVHEHWWGLAHAKHASQLLDCLQSDDSHVRSGAVSQLLLEYRSMTKSLVTSMPRSTWWATCEEAHHGAVGQLLHDFVECVAAVGSNTNGDGVDETSKDGGTGGVADGARLTLATQLPLPRATTTDAAVASTASRSALSRSVSDAPSDLTEQLPIDTSFVAFARCNDLGWEDAQQAALRVASVLLVNEYLHPRVREEGGAYGSSAHATLLDEVGGVAMSSYRDPQPHNTAATFMHAAEWLSDGHNVTQARVNEAKLRLMASIDAPYAADSYGVSYFLHDVSHELRQRMRDRMLAVTAADIVAVAPYFAADGAAVMAKLLPKDMSATTSAPATQGEA